ncbi:hypothetical protein JIN84_05860 [Luteolibacter yonseiensis]|uniref:Galactosylgalactosylxylosylprotein 3-beta-glucuronosyltransferase n=1 Tax=Luteolibacter yonseiensis TaxID=1144680 RepID=A0A934R1N9_9BACT|nr:hypothetical protein [Luteolibacter yonseiensis]MBK1815127.1 hypothetical protein [Luteolibacter yonseiensis]
MENNPLIIITPTWKRPERIPYLRRFAAVLRDAAPLKWLLVEDAAHTDPEVTAFLLETGIDHTYWAVGPTRDKGNPQRDSALLHILANQLHGIIYNGDDDNHYSPALFHELRKVRHIGLLPVGNLGPSGIERPIVSDGRIQYWDAGWKSRKYPVDMAGFAFHTTLLAALQPPLWNHTGVGGESEFIDKLITTPAQFEFLCDNCTTCHVWHNHPLQSPPPA